MKRFSLFQSKKRKQRKHKLGKTKMFGFPKQKKKTNISRVDNYTYISKIHYRKKKVYKKIYIKKKYLLLFCCFWKYFINKKIRRICTYPICNDSQFWRGAWFLYFMIWLVWARRIRLPSVYFVNLPLYFVFIKFKVTLFFFDLSF